MKTYVSNGGRLIACPRAVFHRWNELPYGIWICATGREVLFNRLYEPLYQRSPSGPVEPADPHEWVRDIEVQRWFYDDGTRPESAKRQRATAALAAWTTGLTPTSYPVATPPRTPPSSQASTY